jgi:hypothetical protein
VSRRNWSRARIASFRSEAIRSLNVPMAIG